MEGLIMKLRICLLLASIMGLFAVSAESAQAPWPSDRADLIFAFETAYFRTPAFALDENGKEILAYGLMVRGHAGKDRNFALVVGKGSFVAARIEKKLLASCRESGAFTIEAYITPARSNASARGDIIAFATDKGGGNLVLSQEKDKLVFRLSSGESKEPGSVELCSLKDAKGFQLVVAYSDGLLVCWKDGKETVRRDVFKGGLAGWADHKVVLGSGGDGSGDWSGTPEGIAIMSRAVTAEQAADDFDAYSERIAMRKSARIVRLKGKPS
jgi:hypothetical protein